MKNAFDFANPAVKRIAPATVAALAVAIGVTANALGRPTIEGIDLDLPGALAKVEREHPEHFAKIRRILADVPRRLLGEDSAAVWMNTEFQATDIRYSDVLMTSYPPKKRLQFSLDSTSYVTVITLDIDAKLMRLK